MFYFSFKCCCCRLYLTTTQTSAAHFHPDVIAGTQLISYVPSVETLQVLLVDFVYYNIISQLKVASADCISHHIVA